MSKVLFTVGHSTHELEQFLELVTAQQLEVIADVRSAPYSRWNPQFNREPLEASLSEAGIKYVFLGKELGARSDDPSCYEKNRVQYDRLASTPSFQAGLERVRTGIDNYRVGLMCAEADPLQCHRTILVARNLRAPDLNIRHILKDGELESQIDAEERLVGLTRTAQGGLFDDTGDAVERAYDAQGEKIAYTRQPEGDTSNSEGVIL